MVEVGLFEDQLWLIMLRHFTGCETLLKKVLRANARTDGHPGFRTYSVSGRVANPSCNCASGATVSELIEAGGGMADGHDFGVSPGGASGGILPASKADIPLDFGALS